MPMTQHDEKYVVLTVVVDKGRKKKKEMQNKTIILKLPTGYKIWYVSRLGLLVN
jgi:hypothetical protein